MGSQIWVKSWWRRLVINQLLIWAMLFACALAEKILGGDLFWRLAILPVVYMVGIWQGRERDDAIMKASSAAFFDFIITYDEKIKEMENESRT